MSIALALVAWSALLSCVSIALWIIYCRTLHPLSKVPGPFWPSVTRLWMIHRTFAGDMDVVQRDLHRVYGPLVRIAPNEVAVADPEAIKQIYRIKAPLSKTDFYPIWRNDKYGFTKHPDNFTAIDERVHSNRRRIVNNVYSMSTILTLEPDIDRCCALLVQRLSELARTDAEVDLGEWLQWFSFDVIGELFFGSMFGFMERSEDHASYIASNDTLLPMLVTAAVAPPVYRIFILASALFRSKTRAALKAFDGVPEAAEVCVARRMAADGEKTAGSRKDLMAHLLDVVKAKADEAEFGVGDVKQEAIVALFAGSDTTAIALRAVFYYLCKHPSVFEELQRVIDNAFEQGTLSDPPRYAEAQQLPLLRATIKEAMRLHPSVGLTMPRIVDAAGLDISGMHIPAGTAVGINAAVLGRDKSVYGDDADDFRPQRWLEGDNEVNMDRYSLVFGAGTRTCIGKNISLSEIYKVVPLVIRRLDIALIEPNKDWVTENHWFNKQSGLKVRINIRKDMST